MSCFTIAKEDYMKAAGIIAGMAKEAEVWIYNADAHRNMDKTDYKAKFTECYKMNAESVMERYDGENVGAPADDENTYDELFDKYYDFGVQTIITRENINEILMEISQFLRSSLYQTENEEKYEECEKFYDKIITSLYINTSPLREKATCWGSFNLDKYIDNTPKVTRLF